MLGLSPILHPTTTKTTRPFTIRAPNHGLQKRPQQDPRSVYGCSLCGIAICNHIKCWKEHLEAIPCMENFGGGCQDILPLRRQTMGYHKSIFHTRRMPSAGGTPRTSRRYSTLHTVSFNGTIIKNDDIPGPHTWLLSQVFLWPY